MTSILTAGVNLRGITPAEFADLALDGIAEDTGIHADHLTGAYRVLVVEVLCAKPTDPAVYAVVVLPADVRLPTDVHDPADATLDDHRATAAIYAATATGLPARTTLATLVAA